MIFYCSEDRESFTKAKAKLEETANKTLPLNAFFVSHNNKAFAVCDSCEKFIDLNGGFILLIGILLIDRSCELS